MEKELNTDPSVTVVAPYMHQRVKCSVAGKPAGHK